MTGKALVRKVDRDLGRLLAVHQVEVFQPRERMLQLNAVPIGPCFNKPCTNILLRQRAGGGWQVYVDEDLSYEGDDPERRTLFGGVRRRGWLELTPPAAVEGDVNQAILWGLARLESDLGQLVTETIPGSHGNCASGRNARTVGERAARPLDPILDRVGRMLPLDELAPADLAPTSAQSDAADRVAETVLARLAPTAPLLVGPAGNGKTSVARWAAAELLRRGLIDRVFQMHGAAVAAGAIFWPERDERLRLALEALLALRRPSRATDGACHGTLVILEHFDIVLTRSEVAGPLLADALDRGLKLVAIARPEFRRRQLLTHAPLRRRLERVPIGPPTSEEVIAILRRWLASHPLAAEVELAPAVLPLVASLSLRRPGAGPAAPLGLLEAVLNRAAFAGQRCVGPDDVYHLVPRKGAD